MSERVPSDFTSPSAVGVLTEKTYSIFVSGSNDPPNQLEPPPAEGSINVASGPGHVETTGGVKSGPSLYFAATFSASALISGVQSMRSASDVPCVSYAGGFVGNGCVGEYHSPGTSPFATGRSSIGHTGCPVMRSNTYRNDCFVGCASALMARPFTVMSIRIGAHGMSKS